MRRMFGSIVGFIALAFLIEALTLVPNVIAQTFPSRSISWLIGSSPGGGGDTSSRRLAQRMAKDMRVPIVIKNVPGGGGVIAHTTVWRSRPDGHTVGMYYTQPMITAESFYKVEYRTVDFEWIGNFVDAVYLLCVTKDSPFKSFADMRNSKKPVRIAVNDLTSNSSITMMALSELAGFPITFVSGLGGAAPAVVAALRGEADAVIFGALLFPFIQRGDLIPLIAFSDERLPQFPAVPTIVELGYPELRLIGRLDYVLFAPPGTPRERTRVIQDALLKATREEDKWLRENFFFPDPVPGDELRKAVVEQFNLFKKYIPLVEKYRKPPGR